MKKLLLASTALVLSAGVASAQVALSGDARMGIVYDNSLASAGAGTTNTSRLTFTSRARVTFTLSGETDGGIAFGGSFRADNAGAAAAGTGGSVFISGEFGKLSMGDVAGAARAAVGDLYGVGLTGIGDLNEMVYIDRNPTMLGASVYSFNRRPSVLYEYSIEGFTFYLGAARPNRTDGVGYGNLGLAGNPPASLASAAALAPAAGGSYRESQYSVGVKYSFDGFTIAAGHEQFRASSTGNPSWSANHTIISAEYDMGDFKAKAIAGRIGGNLGTAASATPGLSRSQYGLSVEGNFDAVTATAFVNRNMMTTNYGIGASYDLGGGASMVGGISRRGSNTTLGMTNQTRADFGLNFSF